MLEACAKLLSEERVLQPVLLEANTYVKDGFEHCSRRLPVSVVRTKTLAGSLCTVRC
jgi:hypothetical protein